MVIRLYIILGVALAVALLVIGCQANNVKTSSSRFAAMPRDIDDWVGVPQLSENGAVYFAGQPTESGLKDLAERGVKIVVNLRSIKEMQTKIDFNEAIVVESLGMKYVHIPVVPSSFSPEDVDRLREVLDQADLDMNHKSRILIHCASSNRVGGMWAAYLNSELGFDPDKAIEYGKNAGLRGDSMINAAMRVISKTGIK
ncbi:MAG: protein tyrosine phosphatase family protein [Planctomycetes bacterium]|nr:protein tyrosine phosphatase family protein [Planctomycetota bacterium]